VFYCSKPLMRAMLIAALAAAAAEPASADPLADANAAETRGDFTAVLALAYAKDIGVAQSEVEAYKWYDIAGALAKYADVKDDVTKRREELARAMPPPQIEEAKKLAAEWKARANRQP
jgi:hypothetical protein